MWMGGVYRRCSEDVGLGAMGGGGVSCDVSI